MKAPIFTFLLFFFCASSLKAQLKEFEITEMPRPDVSIVQANTAFPEDALIIVYSSLDNLSFRSSMGAIDKQNYNTVTGRYELLIKPIKQMLFVGKLGFLELKINTLNPNAKDVFYFKVEEKTTALFNQSSPGKLTINSNPVGANISLNGIPVATKTPFTGELNPGRTRIQISKTKYQAFDTVMNIQSSINEVLSINLKPTTLWLNITSNPSAAQVELDGVNIGTTPLSKELDLTDKSKQGARSLKLSFPEYAAQSQTIQVYPSKDPLVFNADLKKLEGEFKIESNPIGAEVFINGIYKGISPLYGVLPVGSYQVELKMDEYEFSSKNQLLVNDKSLANLNVELQVKNQGVDSSITELSGNRFENDTYRKSIKLKPIDFKNRIYGEIGGSDLLLSVNYERSVWQNDKVTLNARLGLGFFSLPIVGLNACIGQNKNKFEIGFTIKRHDEIILYSFSDVTIFINPVLNYRRITQKGFIYGLSFTPIINFNSNIPFFPWLGINLGCAF